MPGMDVKQVDPGDMDFSTATNFTDVLHHNNDLNLPTLLRFYNDPRGKQKRHRLLTMSPLFSWSKVTAYVTVITICALAEPPGPLTVKTTVYVPGVLKVYVGLASALAPPSPNDHE
jgi:hypothetical protein